MNPQLLQNIYEYDPTYRDIYSKCISAFNLKPWYIQSFRIKKIGNIYYHIANEFVYATSVNFGKKEFLLSSVIDIEKTKNRIYYITQKHGYQ